jgi:hypothetical protein
MDMLCNDIMLRGDVSVLKRGNANGSRTQCVLLVTVTTQRGGQQHYAELFTENKAAKTQPFCLWAYCFNFNFSVRESIFTPFSGISATKFHFTLMLFGVFSLLFSADNCSNGVQTPAVTEGSPRLIFIGYGWSCPLS